MKRLRAAVTAARGGFAFALVVYLLETHKKDGIMDDAETWDTFLGSPPIRRVVGSPRAQWFIRRLVFSRVGDELVFPDDDDPNVH